MLPVTELYENVLSFVTGSHRCSRSTLSTGMRETNAMFLKHPPPTERNCKWLSQEFWVDIGDNIDFFGLSSHFSQATNSKLPCQSQLLIENFHESKLLPSVKYSHLHHKENPG
ncbi:hypothetical protein TNCV_2089671 [Trichonephila clavipes]|nr:hypothetical protein TNCV_2089671 [Trichonephila clavipes]